MDAPSPKPKQQRLSLTKKQLEDPAALELLALLQTVTSDGKVLDEEIQSVRAWLDAHRDSSLPAVRHLSGVVGSVLEDGRITPEERTWLQKALETVLPREQRELALVRRREVLSDERRQKAEFEQKSRPVAAFDFMVAGVFHEGRQRIITENVSIGDPVFLVRDLQNQYTVAMRPRSD